MPTKVHIVKAMVFPVVMKGCERWTIKKTEHQRTDAFKLSVGKDPDAGRDLGQEEKETTEDEMAGWHHRLEFE